tara:strand:- start:297 stop:995 length:699 start_codon:yes stop_codon:yes gene_type:complete
MKAMILCAGYGKRLNPMTLNCPKPLLKIGNETLLSKTLKFLKNCGINQIVINVHYLGQQIIDYVDKNKLNLSITIVEEKKDILNTGGGVLNAINNFSNEPFLIVNPDTIWHSNYSKELKIMEKVFSLNKNSKCCMLVINKKRSFDQNFKGDFNLENNLINRKNKDNLKYIYTGLQIIDPKVFSSLNSKIFSINVIWDQLIKNNELYGVESNIDFFHVSTINTYKKLLEKFKY